MFSKSTKVEEIHAINALDGDRNHMNHYTKTYPMEKK